MNSITKILGPITDIGHVQYIIILYIYKYNYNIIILFKIKSTHDLNVA